MCPPWRFISKYGKVCSITSTFQSWLNRIHEPIQASRYKLKTKMTAKFYSIFVYRMLQFQTFLPEGAPVLDMKISFQRSCVHHYSLISTWAISLWMHPTKASHPIAMVFTYPKQTKRHPPNHPPAKAQYTSALCVLKPTNVFQSARDTPST